MTEVIIIGGGPAGCHVACELARSFDVLVLEEHKEIGHPLQCMGLVTDRVVSFVPPEKRGELIETTISKGKVSSPSGKELSLEFKEPKAFVIDRVNFDRALAELAMDRGAEIELGSRVERARRPDRVEVEYKGLKRRCDILIGADGPRSLVRSTFFPPTPIEFISCYGAEVDSKIESEEACAHVFLGGEVAPLFFAWTLPTRGGARIGVGVSEGRPYPYFKRLANRFRGKITRPIAGEIPIGLLPHFTTDRIALVGDACCQVKPISGGGLFTGLLGAQICSRSIIEGDLKNYRKRWISAIGEEVASSLRWRGLIRAMGDDDIERLFSLLDKPGSKEALQKGLLEGDLDYQSRSAKMVIRSLSLSALASVLRVVFSIILKKPRSLIFKAPKEKESG
jgi:geranylgeranyl reductase family protein